MDFAFLEYGGGNKLNVVVWGEENDQGRIMSCI